MIIRVDLGARLRPKVASSGRCGTARVGGAARSREAKQRLTVEELKAIIPKCSVECVEVTHLDTPQANR